MLSRRRFLGYSIVGAISAASGCRPTNFNNALYQNSSANRLDPLLENKEHLPSHKNYLLGYPINMNTPPEEFFAWRNKLRKIGIGDYAFNNVGNPYIPSSIEYNTHDLEKEVIARFGNIYRFEKNDTWGFLSHSGTDSNMHGMYMGRTILQSNSREHPICYFTKEAHYSIQILSDLLGMKRVFVATLPDASMDSEDLKSKLKKHPNNPALVVATIGTTFKGAVDDVDRIQGALKGVESYLHLDAALFGGYLPHTKGADMVFLNSRTGYRYDSIAVSCHKFFGFPSPAGLFIATQKNYDMFNEQYSRIHNPEYIGHVPGTITCSRDAVKPAEFYYFSTPSALSKQADDAQLVLKNTTYLLDQMQTQFAALHPVRSNHFSNTVYFKMPGKQIVKKYSLATMQVELNGEYQDYAHIVVMPHANKDIISEFLTDLRQDNSLQFG